MKRTYIIVVMALILIGATAVGVFAAHRSANTVAKTQPAPVAAAAAPVTPIVVPASKAVVDEQVPILVYHSVEPKGTKKETKMAQHYHIYPENFEAQMQYLKDNGYTPITLGALADHYLNGSDIPAKSVVLTFDDGWKNQYDYAFPILKKFGYSASFFIISGYPDGNYHAYMTWDDIKALDAAGMEIGSHTVHHVNLAKTSDASKIKSEIVDSKAEIEKKIGHTIQTFVYPEYGQNAAVQLVVKDAGYVAARGGWTKTKNGKDTIFVLKSQESVNNRNPFSDKVAK